MTSKVNPPSFLIFSARLWSLRAREVQSNLIDCVADAVIFYRCLERWPRMRTLLLSL